MKTNEERVHTALTHLVAALDWSDKGIQGLVESELRQSLHALDGCFYRCERCDDRMWRELVKFEPKSGKALCPPCWKQENDREPSDADRELSNERHWDAYQRDQAALRDAGRQS